MLGFVRVVFTLPPLLYHSPRIVKRKMNSTSSSKIRCIGFDCGGVLCKDVPGIMFQKLALRYPEAGVLISIFQQRIFLTQKHFLCV
jgi:hypothetical protein